MAAQSDRCEPRASRRDDPAVLLYTSGSTGPPKGVQIAANFLVAIHPSMRYGVDLQADDVFWPTGDPGWGYGLVCYMLALAMGVTVSFQEAAPTAERCLERLRDAGVTNLAATPTLLRSIMALGAEAVRRYPVRVRAASCCGEPLNAEVVTFFREQLGRDGDGPLRLERARPADRQLQRDRHGGASPARWGGRSRAARWRSWTTRGTRSRTTWSATSACSRIPRATTRSATGTIPIGRGRCTAGPWLTCGDLARRDSDGYFWFEGRADDVIKSAGYRIGPFEVESALLLHPAVAEAAVVGVPDALRGHIVKAYVVLKAERAPYPGLEDELVDVVKTHVGRHQYPRAIELLDELPKTETGKIQRFLLRQRP